MLRGAVCALLLALALATANPVRVSPSGNVKGVSLEGRLSHFYLQPDTTNINLQVLPGLVVEGEDSHEGGSKLLSIQDAMSDAIGEIVIHGKGLSTDVVCHQHKQYMACLLDVDCGWCNGRNGSYCVEGSFGGPCNASIDCPVYTTYQQPGMGSHDCGTGTRPCVDQEDESQIFHPFGEAPASDVLGGEEAPEQQAKPAPKISDNDLRALLGGVDSDEGEEAVAVKRHSAKAASHAMSLAQAVDHLKFDEGATRIVPEAEMASPCGLRGTSDMMCRDWVLKHCGGENPANDAACDMALFPPN